MRPVSHQETLQIVGAHCQMRSEVYRIPDPALLDALIDCSELLVKAQPVGVDRVGGQ
jgi:hypothetical protein